MLKDIFGNHPQIKVIDYMLSCPFHELTKQQLAVGSEISRSTLDKFIDDFLEYELLCRKGSKYVVNFKSEFIRDFYNISNRLVKIEIEKQEQLPEEEFDVYSDDELDEIFSDIPDEVDLEKLEFEIETKEFYTFSSDKSTKNSFELSLL
ncbi:MAG: hypothetical protein IJL02_07290 [Methanobrevibacter sp.]|uniref:hypothetical protein n=1 Tax=Methanobrevibacter sp. TaxID=66852 RepID=UPI0025FF0B40|nr:hypothetical protein [Methanobrevibacter sp.]MBQ6099650.1 hypothetical protein [Methanobrevibacter sp.]